MGWSELDLANAERKLAKNRNPAAFAKQQEAKAAAVEAGEEIKLQGEIAQYLRLRDIPYIKPDARKKSPLPEGWPDFTLAYLGVPLALEVKTESGVLSEAQATMHTRLRSQGWKVFVVRSLPNVKTILDSIAA